jgi:hypothetical protein
MSQLPSWLRQAVKEQVISLPQAQELAQLSKDVPQGQYVDVPDHLKQATADLWLWELEPLNNLPV